MGRWYLHTYIHCTPHSSSMRVSSPICRCSSCLAPPRPEFSGSASNLVGETDSKRGKERGRAWAWTAHSSACLFAYTHCSTKHPGMYGSVHTYIHPHIHTSTHTYRQLHIQVGLERPAGTVDNPHCNTHTTTCARQGLEILPVSSTTGPP